MDSFYIGTKKDKNGQKEKKNLFGEEKSTTI